MISLLKSRSLLRLLACLLALGPVSAQETSGVIEGAVYGQEGKPLGHVLVVLKTPLGRQEQTLTDLDGRYAFTNLGRATYIISVEPEKPYMPDSQAVTLWTGRGEMQRADFRLEQTESQRRVGPAEPVFQQEIPAGAEKAYAQAVAHLRARESKEAVAELERAVGIFPDYFLALNQLGLEHMQHGAVEEAAGWFRRAAGVNPNSASAHFGLGWTHYQAGQFEAAAPEFRLSAQLNRRIAETHYYLGLTALEIKELGEAEAAFKACLELSGEGERQVVYLYLTSVYDQQGRYGEAIEALKSYLGNVPPEKRTAKLQELLKRLERKQKQGRS